MVWVFGLMVGFLFGVLGAGGSIITVPVLHYGLGLSPREAIVTSLAIVGIVASFGAMMEIRSRRVNLGSAALFGAGGIFGSFVGARLSRLAFDESSQLLLFVAVLLVASVAMLRSSGRGLEEEDARRASPWVLVAAGAAIGVVSAIVGVGGGFMIVPALTLLGGLGIKEAVGTSLVVISVNSVIALVGYGGQPVPDSSTVGIFAGLGIFGSWAGAHLRRRLSPTLLRRCFAMFLILLGAYMLYDKALS